MAHQKIAIVLDVDSCLYDFVGSYAKFIRNRGYKEVYQKDIQSYHFAADFGIEPKESKQLFDEFTDYGGFKHLIPYPGAHDLFDWLRDKNIQIILATDVPTRAQSDRLLNLQYHGFFFKDIAFGPNKDKVVNEVGAKWVLDDHFDHITKCLDNTSADVFCPTWPYNIDILHPRLTHLGPPQTALLKLVKKLDEKWRIR